MYPAKCIKRVDATSGAIVTEPREVKHGYRAGDSTEKGALSAIPVSARSSILFAVDLSQIALPERGGQEVRGYDARSFIPSRSFSGAGESRRMLQRQSARGGAATVLSAGIR